MGSDEAAEEVRPTTRRSEFHRGKPDFMVWSNVDPLADTRAIAKPEPAAVEVEDFAS